MQVLDILLMAGAIAVLVGHLYPLDRNARRGVAGAAVALLVAHVWSGAARWQVESLYMIILLGGALLLLRTGGGISGLIGRLSWTAGLAFVLLSAALAYVLPVPEIPAPTGPLKIGTMTWQFDDTARKDPYAPMKQGATERTEPRRIMLQAWYPAQIDALEMRRPAPWCPDVNIFGPAIAEKLGLPAFILGHLEKIQSHAFEGAGLKMDSGKWPVVVYSHGWTGFRSIALDEIEALVSHGYIVFAPDHPYGALATVLKDGTPVLNNPAAMPPDEPKDARQQGIELLVDMYAGDIRYVLDLIEKMNAGTVTSPFKDMLDVSKVGIYGHSTGGGAVYEVAATDPRVKCVFGYDTWTEPISPDVRAKPLTVPFFSLRSAQWALRQDAKAKILADLLAQAQGPKFDFYLQDSGHADFTLLPILSPLASRLGQSGPIDGRRSLEVSAKYLVAFFDQFLRGKESPLMISEVKEIPEVRRAPVIK